MAIGDRVKELRKNLGMTQEELASRLGYRSKSSVTHIEKGRDIPRSVITELAEILGTTPAYLMGWTDEISAAAKEPVTTFDNIFPVRLKKFPLLGDIACGKPIFADEDRENTVMADMDINADFCLRAKGDSMINARIHDGDIVFIRQTDLVENGDIAAVVIDDEATLKRVYYDRSNSVLQLVAENPRYAPLVFTGEELDHVHILGRAVYFMSAL